MTDTLITRPNLQAAASCHHIIMMPTQLSDDEKKKGRLPFLIIQDFSTLSNSFQHYVLIKWGKMSRLKGVKMSQQKGVKYPIKKGKKVFFRSKILNYTSFYRSVRQT